MIPFARLREDPRGDEHRHNVGDGGPMKSLRERFGWISWVGNVSVENSVSRPLKNAVNRNPWPVSGAVIPGI
jgi:hypothetical protein